MRTILVTRHLNVASWVESQGIDVDVCFPHLEIGKVDEGDRVIGNLPLSLVSELIKKNCTYLNIEMSVPFEYRGKELTVDQMNEFGACLTSYSVYKND